MFVRKVAGEEEKELWICLGRSVEGRIKVKKLLCPLAGGKEITR